MDEETALELKTVEEFASRVHGDLERIKELLSQEPALINAAWNFINCPRKSGRR